MVLYYARQDNTIWGCGDPDCCGENYEDIEDIFVEMDPKIEITNEEIQIKHGGGPVLEFRMATALECTAYRNGTYDGWTDGYEDGILQNKKAV